MFAVSNINFCFIDYLMREVQCDKFNFKNNLLTLDIIYYNFSFLLNMYLHYIFYFYL